MSHSTKLPDAMPEIESPSLLVVSDTHQCRFIDAGGHTLLEQSLLHSSEIKHTDRQTVQEGAGGQSIGIGDDHHAEDHRLNDFAKKIIAGITASVAANKIEAVYVAAPAKLLSEIRKHVTPALSKLVKATVDGNFLKESSLDVLVRFMPQLQSSVQALRDLENYSSKKHLPK